MIVGSGTMIEDVEADLAAEHNRIAEAEARGRRQGIQSDVPCNGCTACCHGPIVLHPSLGDDPSHYATELIEGFGLILRRNPDGSCIYLTKGGCSIWPNRPGVCRAFDCRAYARSAWAKLDPLRDEAVIAAGLSRGKGNVPA